MTDTPPVDLGPVDTAASAPTEPPTESALREQFAQYTAGVFGEWLAVQPWQRQGVGAIAPRLARALYLAEMTIDLMIGEAPYGDEQAEALLRELIGLPDPEPLLARLNRCGGTIALPDDGTFAYCGTRLTGGACPFAAHHAPPPVLT